MNKITSIAALVFLGLSYTSCDADDNNDFEQEIIIEKSETHQVDRTKIKRPGGQGVQQIDKDEVEEPNER